MLACPISLSAQTDPAAAAAAVFEQFLSSFTNADSAGVVALFAEDAKFWGTSSKALVEQTSGIEQYFSNLANTPPGQTIARAVDYSVLVVADNLAVVSGVWEVIPAGTTTPVPLRVSLAVALRNGQWKIVQFHNSRVPE